MVMMLYCLVDLMAILLVAFFASKKRLILLSEKPVSSAIFWRPETKDPGLIWMV